MNSLSIPKAAYNSSSNDFTNDANTKPSVSQLKNNLTLDFMGPTRAKRVAHDEPNTMDGVRRAKQMCFNTNTPTNSFLQTPIMLDPEVKQFTNGFADVLKKLHQVNNFVPNDYCPTPSWIPNLQQLLSLTPGNNGFASVLSPGHTLLDEKNCRKIKENTVLQSALKQLYNNNARSGMQSNNQPLPQKEPSRIDMGKSNQLSPPNTSTSTSPSSSTSSISNTNSSSSSLLSSNSTAHKLLTGLFHGTPEALSALNSCTTPEKQITMAFLGAKMAAENNALSTPLDLKNIVPLGGTYDRDSFNRNFTDAIGHIEDSQIKNELMAQTPIKEPFAFWNADGMPSPMTEINPRIQLASYAVANNNTDLTNNNIRKIIKDALTPDGNVNLYNAIANCSAANSGLSFQPNNNGKINNETPQIMNQILSKFSPQHNAEERKEFLNNILSKMNGSNHHDQGLHNTNQHHANALFRNEHLDGIVHQRNHQQQFQFGPHGIPFPNHSLNYPNGLFFTNNPGTPSNVSNPIFLQNLNARDNDMLNSFKQDIIVAHQQQKEYTNLALLQGQGMEIGGNNGLHMNMPCASNPGSSHFSASGRASNDTDIDINQRYSNSYDVEDQDSKKLERKRARNRLAATRCRQRKIDRINQLEIELQTEKNMVQKLRDELAEHQARATTFHQQIKQHRDSGCNLKC